VEFDDELIDALMRAMPIGDLVTDEVGWEEAAEPRLAVLAEIAAPDLTTAMVGSAGGLAGEFHGLAGYRQAWADWLAPFAAYTSTFESIREAPGDRLVVLTRQRARPRDSTAEVETDGAAALTFRAGKLSRVEFHLDRGAALRSAGLAAP
jgi:ketosteroid isomerase-like protein